MPAAVCPSFPWRPSTTSTLLLPSVSIRQTPTTLTNDFGSAPTVSSEKSILSGWTALALKSNAVRPTPATATVNARLIVLMTDLHLGQVAGECVGHGGSTTR